MIDKIYSKLDCLYKKTSNPYECIVESRKLLEQSFKHAVNINSDEKISLGQCMNAYYSLASSDKRYESIANQLRAQLNKLIHDSDLDLESISTLDLLALLNKVRGVLDAIFGKKTLDSTLKYQSDTNQDQTLAIHSTARFTLVQAGPGTGKTHLIVERLIRDLNNCRNKKIVGLAFTNEAAKNLQNRFTYKVFGTENFQLSHLVQIGTIHSFALNSLRAYAKIKQEEFPFEVIDQEEYRQIELEFNHSEELIADYLRANNLLTFDKIIEICLDQLKNDPDFQKFLTSDLYEVVIDEAQDLALQDSRLIGALFSNSPDLRIFAVGDQRQNIFAFRSGSIKNVLESVNYRPTYFSLHRSYRCPESVLSFVNQIKFADCENPPLHNPKNPGCAIHFSRTLSEHQEFSEIADKINELHHIKNIAFSQISILTPTSYSFNNISNELNSHQIPFKSYGGIATLKPEIRAFLNFIGAIESKKYPLLKLSSNLAEGISIKPNEKFEDILLKLIIRSELLNQKDASSVFNLVADNIQFSNSIYNTKEQMIELANAYTSAKRCDNATASLLLELVEFIFKLNIKSQTELKQLLSPGMEEAQPFFDSPSVKSLFIEEYPTNYVSLSTIHSAKGKEWDYVFVPGLTMDKFPAYRRNINDETKKFFVACTRSKKELFLSSPMSYVISTARGLWNRTNLPPSIFVKNLDLD